ncbi:MAG: hypothetical protein ACRDN6_09345 [Gaiellaceae bacterium]
MRRAAGICLLAGALAGCGGGGGGGGGASAGDEVRIELTQQNASSEFGTVTLTPLGDQTRILVETEGPFDREFIQPVHIHKGTCGSLDVAEAYPLPILQDGITEETLEVSLDELLAAGLAIESHKSEQDDTPVTCGEIKTE